MFYSFQGVLDDVQVPGRSIATGVPATGTPTSLPDITQQCVTLWSGWAQKNPDTYKCLTARQSQKLVELCVAWKTGTLPFSDYVARVNALQAGACVTDSCRRDLAASMQQLPDGGRCLTSADRRNIVDWCVATKTGSMTSKRYLRRVRDLVAAHCKPASGGGGGGGGTTPSGGGGSTPTSGDVLPSGGEVHDEGAAAPTEEPSLLRQWGPVVGIGLLIALGLTVASQSKGKKKRR